MTAAIVPARRAEQVAWLHARAFHRARYRRRRSSLRVVCALTFEDGMTCRYDWSHAGHDSPHVIDPRAWCRVASPRAVAAIGHDAAPADLEPGVLRLVRILVIMHVLGTSLVRRAIGTAMGLNAPILPSFMLALPVPLFLVALVWIPSWQGRRGRVLLSLALALASVNVLAVAEGERGLRTAVPLTARRP